MMTNIKDLLKDSILYKHQIEFLEFFGIRGNYEDIVIVSLVKTEVESEMIQYRCLKSYPTDSPILSDMDRIMFKTYFLNEDFTQTEFEDRLKVWFKDYIDKLPLGYLTSKEQSNHKSRIEFLYDFYLDIKPLSEIRFTVEYEYHEFDELSTADGSTTEGPHFQKYNTADIIKWVQELLYEHELEDVSDEVYDYDFEGMKTLIKTKMKKSVNPKAYGQRGYKIMKKSNTKGISDECIGWTSDPDFVKNLNTFTESQGLDTVFVAQSLEDQRR